MRERGQGTLTLQTAFCLTVLAIAILYGPQVGSSYAEDTSPADGVFDPSSQERFVSVSLEDLRATDDLIIVQDADGPTVMAFQVCESVQGYADYELNPTHEFSRSLFGRAWLYIEVGEIDSAEQPDGTYSLSLSADVVVSNADERVVWKKDRAYSFDERLPSPAFGVWAYAYVPTIILGSGEYNVEITVNDNISGKRTRVNALVRIR